MKNTCKLFGVMKSIAMQSRRFCAIALVAVIGFAITACPTEGGGGNNTDDDPPPKGVVSQPPTTNPNSSIGVWVDTNGNLRINAPVKTINQNEELVDYTGSEVTVKAVIYFDYEGMELPEELATGTITNGTLQISIPPLASNLLTPAGANIPPGFVKAGANIKIGEVKLEIESSPDSFFRLDLVNDFGFYETYNSWYANEQYRYTYSEGDVTVSGRLKYPGGDIACGMLLKKGWNSVSQKYSFVNNYSSGTMISKPPPSTAVWVLKRDY